MEHHSKHKAKQHIKGILRRVVIEHRGPSVIGQPMGHRTYTRRIVGKGRTVIVVILVMAKVN